MNTQNQQLSIFQTFAASRQMEKEALIQTLFKTIAPADATMEDLVGFLQIAHRFQLDPWAKEIFLIKSKGRVSTYISVDGYATIVNREREYDGCEFTYDQDDQGRIIACTCSMYRKDRTRPTVVTEFLDECMMPNSEAWRKAPGRMLRHRAFVQAARLAFGITGALDEGSEVPGPTIDITDAPAPAPAPVAPKPRRSPPSPGQGDKQEKVRPGSPPETAQASETKAEDVSDEFDVDGCLDALKSAKSMDELKQIYNDYEVDENLQDKPTQLELVQDTFVRMTKRIEREVEKGA
jgi:phage recombination protein Bet